jgi:hypothetical protein
MDKGTYGREIGEVLVTRPDTGDVQRQVAYYDSDSETWTVGITTYPRIDESSISGRPDPIESEMYSEPMSQGDIERRYPELWGKVKHFED